MRDVSNVCPDSARVPFGDDAGFVLLVSVTRNSSGYSSTLRSSS